MTIHMHNVSHAQHFIVLTKINIEGGPRYKPPEVSRGSPVLHCSLTISLYYNQRSYSYAKIFVSRDSDRVARDEPHH